MSGSHSGVDAAALANKRLEELGLPLLPGSQPTTDKPKTEPASTDKTKS